jgi:GT2 family glycosyltransferase
VVERVGLPREDFFWWIEDTEYLQWRIPRSGAGVRWTDTPVMEISRNRSDASKPSWKYYYEARNQVYYRVHVQRSTQRPPPRPLTVRIRTWRAVRTVTKLAVRSAVRERDQRARKLWMVVRGTGDGLVGRLGRTVPVDDSHRPVIAASPRDPS